MTRGASAVADNGSAPVDFVLVGSWVTLLFLGLLQLGIDYHVRNVLAACVADGARYGANADVASPDAGATRANTEIRQALGSSYAVTMTMGAAPSRRLRPRSEGTVTGPGAAPFIELPCDGLVLSALRPGTSSSDGARHNRGRPPPHNKERARVGDTVE